MLDGTHYFECGCGMDEHTLRFTLDMMDDEEPCGKALFTSIFLNDYHRWYQRLWIGIKYIFGYKCKYGHWDCWVLHEPDAVRLRKMLNEFLSALEAEEIKPYFENKPSMPANTSSFENQTS